MNFAFACPSNSVKQSKFTYHGCFQLWVATGHLAVSKAALIPKWEDAGEQMERNGDAAGMLFLNRSTVSGICTEVPKSFQLLLKQT